MSLAESIDTRLQGIGTVYRSKAPQSTALPYLIFQTVSGNEDIAFEGPTGLMNSRIQIDAYAVTATAAEVLWKLARDVMKVEGTDFSCGAIQTQGEVPELGLVEDAYRYTGDFSLWHEA